MTAERPTDASRAIYRPDVALRGARIYVHSTDLYAELMVGAARAGWTPLVAIDLRIKQLIRTAPEFRFDGETAVGDSDAAGRFALAVGLHTFHGRIVATDRPVTVRRPYDERRIWDLARLAERQISLTGESGMAPIEVVTALGVLLHNTVLPPPTGMRWLLARLTLVRPLEPSDARTVNESLEHVLGGSTRTALTAADGPLGTMQFILGAV